MGRRKLSAHVPPEPKRAFSVCETAALISVHEDSVRKLISRGELGHVRVGERIIVPREAIDEWLARPRPLAAAE